MALAPGTRVGPYEILTSLGVGGMGEVYRARDTKLNRNVAIKVLLDDVATDPERLARFSREAQMLASLNHPNVAQIHGVDDSSSVLALVLELVEGSTLADRIAASGPIPVDEALGIAKQIAEAVEAAHEQGIIHRDLKPANIKIRPDGLVKVLDFGLAKALDPLSAATDATISPTLSLNMTRAGVILGTAAYMAPEQARGKPVGTRADIWAFGCVLFEMLTGERAFKGDDVTDTIVAVMSKEPDWGALPTAAAAIRPLIARCLKKDPKQRLQAIGDARIHLDELIAGTGELPLSSSVSTRRAAPAARHAIAAVIGSVLTAAVMWVLFIPRGPLPPRPVRFEIVTTPAHALAIHGADRDIALSPDGQTLVYRGGPQGHLVVRTLDRLDDRVLDGSANARSPFFSPDGQWVGFFQGLFLKKVPVAGGPVITICRSQVTRGASWGADGHIVFATSDDSTGLLRVAAAGGEPTQLTVPDRSKGERYHWHPFVLPNTDRVLFTIRKSAGTDVPGEIAVFDQNTRETKILVRGGSQAQYVATGHLAYGIGGTLSAVRFDLERLEVTSDPVSVIDSVWMAPGGAASYVVSRQGTLVYVPQSAALAPLSLMWVDRAGRATPTGAPPHAYTSPRLSPDGARIAVTIRDQQDDIHIFDRKRATLMRLASTPDLESTPMWTADGTRIVFASQRDGVTNLYAQAADGTGTMERLTTAPDAQLPGWVAPDGSGILGSEISPKTAGDIVWFPRGASRPERLVNSHFIEYHPEVAPNGRYIAYQSNESGQDEIYVRPFPRVQDGKWRVSSNGGWKPLWARKGRELYYIDPSYSLMAVPVDMSSTTFAFGTATKLFPTEPQGPYGPRNYDVADDGRFLITKPLTSDVSQLRSNPVVVLNWFEELNAKLPARRN